MPAVTQSSIRAIKSVRCSATWTQSISVRQALERGGPALAIFCQRPPRTSPLGAAPDLGNGRRAEPLRGDKTATARRFAPSGRRRTLYPWPVIPWPVHTFGPFILLASSYFWPE